MTKYWDVNNTLLQTDFYVMTIGKYSFEGPDGLYGKIVYAKIMEKNTKRKLMY